MTTPRRRITSTKGHVVVSEPHGNGNGNGNGTYQRYSTIIQTITTVGLFVAGLWAGVIQPMSARIDHVADNYLTIAEHRQYRDSVEKRLATLEEQVVRIQEGQVTRSEQKQRWDETDSRFTALHTQVDDLAKQFQSVYSAGDAFKTLQKELDDLRVQLHADTQYYNFPQQPGAPTVIVPGQQSQPQHLPGQSSY